MRAAVSTMQNVERPEPTVLCVGPDHHQVYFGRRASAGSLSCDTAYLLALLRSIRIYLDRRGELPAGALSLGEGMEQTG